MSRNGSMLGNCKEKTSIHNASHKMQALPGPLQLYRKIEYTTKHSNKKLANDDGEGDEMLDHILAQKT